MAGLLENWNEALKSRAFVVLLSITLVLLILLAVFIGDFFAHVQETPGGTINDVLLDWLRPRDVSIVIFALIYGSVLLAAIAMASLPWTVLEALMSYVLLVLLRMISMSLVVLEPHPSIIPLRDPLVDAFFYNDVVITKDLFFSGHVSLLVLLFFYMKNPTIRMVLLLTSISVAILLLVQHAHYTIDVLVAPVFVIAARYSARRIVEPFTGKSGWR